MEEKLLMPKKKVCEYCGLYLESWEKNICDECKDYIEYEYTKSEPEYLLG